jgi:hypothetical protein
MLEGGCGHARCFQCCCSSQESQSGCPQCHSSRSSNNGERNEGSSGGEGSGSGVGAPIGGGRESGFQSYAPSVASVVSGSGSGIRGDDRGSQRDYFDYPGDSVSTAASSPPASVISLLPACLPPTPTCSISGSIYERPRGDDDGVPFDQLYPLRRSLKSETPMRRDVAARRSMCNFAPAPSCSGSSNSSSVRSSVRHSGLFDFARRRSSALFSSGSVVSGGFRKADSNRSVAAAASGRGGGCADTNRGKLRAFDLPNV